MESTFEVSQQCNAPSRLLNVCVSVGAGSLTFAVLLPDVASLQEIIPFIDRDASGSILKEMICNRNLIAVHIPKDEDW